MPGGSEWTARVAALAAEAELEADAARAWVEEVSRSNHRRVWEAFRAEAVSEFHLKPTEGYGYGDVGRGALDRLYARVFGAEAALVRPQFVSGTHALAACLFAALRPGDELLAATGRPYDTLCRVIGLEGSEPGSLKEWGISYRQVDGREDGPPEPEEVARAVGRKTRLVLFQRSRGYRWRPGPDMARLGMMIAAVKAENPRAICLVDNCYGEFVEALEPPSVGADLTAGSLIKNPGGGLAPGGGYVAGRAGLVAEVAARLTAPGLGGEVGANPEGYRLYFQGLYMAPLVVAQALRGAVFAASLMGRLGFAVSPRPQEKRTDIVQAVRLGNRERLVAFCRGLQAGSPVDAHIVPEPSPMPGYGDEVIMAAGTFVQGATLELTADAPLRPPYDVFLQGGLSYHYARLGLIEAALALAREGLLPEGRLPDEL